MYVCLSIVKFGECASSRDELQGTDNPWQCIEYIIMYKSSENLMMNCKFKINVCILCGVAVGQRETEIEAHTQVTQDNCDILCTVMRLIYIFSFVFVTVLLFESSCVK